MFSSLEILTNKIVTWAVYVDISTDSLFLLNSFIPDHNESNISQIIQLKINKYHTSI